jgi:phage/plasmid-like protein (TIGR03299 family)
MSAETREYLSQNTLIGFTDKRGNAWHYREGDQNHFPGAVPLERVEALMNYPLAEAQLTATILGPDGVASYEVSDRKAIVRTDTGVVFGVFSTNGYKIHQPQEWLVDNLQTILDGGLQVGSAVLLKQGAVAAVQGELEDTRDGVEGIKHRPCITAATSHDGSLATTYLTGTQVVVCDNTLSLALREQGAAKNKIRHSRNSLGRAGQVRENLGLVVEQVGDEFDAEVRRLLEDHVSDERWNDFTKAYSGYDEDAEEGRGKTMAQGKVAILNRLWTFDERVAPWKNTAYGVVAAVNTAVHHEFTIKGMERAERNMLRTVNNEWAKVDDAALALLAQV